MTKFQIAGAFLLWSCIRASATVQDYVINTNGPHHVVQGHNLFFSAKAVVTSGDNENAFPSIVGLPIRTTATFPNLLHYCCGVFMWTVDQENPVKISTSITTPTGVYPLTLKYITASGLQRSTSYLLYADPQPLVINVQHFPAAKQLASVAQWNSNMLLHGKEHCTTSELALVETSVWYYDGERVYYQIADATGDPTWNACAQLIGHFYRSYVLSTNGVIPGWRVFPHGQALDYQRTSDPLSLQALGELATATSDFNVNFLIGWPSSRETSYTLETQLQTQALGSPTNPVTNDLVDLQLGDFDQWFVSNNVSYIQPFMVALAAEALIEYWDTSHDPRIPPILQLAADQLWKRSWNSSCQCFNYYNDDGSVSLSQDLNLLIAPLYGWVYQQTAYAGYRDQGDQIFSSGVAGAWLGGGKQFSQNYRWSGKYLDWREGDPKPNKPVKTGKT
jgi:hypothetical protein